MHVGLRAFIRRAAYSHVGTPLTWGDIRDKTMKVDLCHNLFPYILSVTLTPSLLNPLAYYRMYCKHHTCIVSYRMWCHYLTVNAWLNVIDELAVNIQRYFLWSETSRGTGGEPIQHHLLRNAIQRVEKKFTAASIRA